MRQTDMHMCKHVQTQILRHIKLYNVHCRIHVHIYALKYIRLRLHMYAHSRHSRGYTHGSLGLFILQNSLMMFDESLTQFK